MGSFQELEARVAKLEGGYKRLSDTVESMETMLRSNTKMTSDIYEIVSNLKGFGKTVKMVGGGLIFVGKFIIFPIASIGGVLYALFHHGRFPEWFIEMMKALWG